MSGGQVSFFASEGEQKEFLCALIQKENVEIYYRQRVSGIVHDFAASCNQLISHPLSAFSLSEKRGGLVILFLWNPAILGTLASVRAEGGTRVTSNG